MNSAKRLDSLLQSQLNKLADQGSLRTLQLSTDKIDFASNDYLGFAAGTASSSPALTAGSAGSRLISGDSELARQTEEKIADFHRAEAALVFSSGYSANLGLFSCLARPEDFWISDELVHASIIDGMRLSKAERKIFRHNDLQHLEDLLQTCPGRAFVATESLFSMNGDTAPLIEMASLCEKYGAYLVVDEAHAAGVLGPDGRGLVCEYGLEGKVAARIFTYGKAFGTAGAAVAGSAALRSYLINFARSFIFSTAPPPLLFHSIADAYERMPEAPREALNHLCIYFERKLSEYGISSFLPAQHHIRALILKQPEKAKQISSRLWEQGIYAKAILPPTVAAGTERIRICLHSFNKCEEVDQLLKIISAHI